MQARFEKNSAARSSPGEDVSPKASKARAHQGRATGDQGQCENSEDAPQNLAATCLAPNLNSLHNEL